MATLTGKKIKNWYKSILHFEDELPATSTKKVVQDGDGNALPLKISTSSVEFTGNVEGIDKNDVGLGNVDNTSDANKPVSTAQQTAIDLAITNLKDGVATPGNTLQKLYNIILGQTKEVTVANIAARDAYDVPSLPLNIFVTNDGDGNWALYKATTTGVGATFVKLSDPDLLNAVMSAATIKSSYESNADTNAFTDALEAKLNAIEASADVTDAGNVGSAINGTPNKATPVDADKIPMINSTGTVLNYFTWANLKATLLSTWKDVSGGLVGMTLYKINFKNVANTFTSFFTNSNTAARTYTFQDKDQTIAGLDDTTLSADASGTDTYTATITPAITAYAAHQRFYIKFPNANTGAATLNLNSLGAKSIKKNGNTDLAATDIKTGQIYCLAYDGTNFQILTWIGAAGGGGDMLASNNLSEVNPSSAKTNLGLNNVDNTSDANKPVSTAQQTAIDLAITNLKDGVATPGNTLQKLYNIILGQTNEVTVANIAARDAYNVTSLPTNIFVTNDGDGNWALYKATTTGVGATFVKLSDPDLLNAVMSAATIKSSYESNADTNAFTNALLSKLNAIEASADVTDAGNVGSAIDGSSSKTTPVDADKIAIINSVGGVLAYLTWSNLKATLLSTWKDVTGGLVGMTLYKINFKNAANTFTSFLTNANTAARTYTFPDRDITVAGVDELNKTKYHLLSNWTIMPDASGNCFLEPASIKQTNDRYHQMRIILKDSGTKTGFGLSFIVPEDYVSAPYIGIIWGSNATSGNNVVFDVDYTCAAFNTTLDPSSDEENATATTADSATSQMGVVTEIALTAGNLAAGHRFAGNIMRDGANGSDTLASDLYIAAIYLKYNNH